MRRIMAALVIVALISSCAKPKDLEFIDVQNLRMVKWGFTESQIGIDVRFYNPNNQQVQMKDAAVKVYANSAYLGDTKMDSVVSVPRRDTFAIPLILRVQTGTAVSQIMQSLSDSTIAIKVEGNVKMGKGGVFLNYPIRYERLQKVSELNF